MLEGLLSSISLISITRVDDDDDIDVVVGAVDLTTLRWSVGCSSVVFYGGVTT